MKLSIVSTLYKSSSSIADFYVRTGNAAKKLVGNDYELILVNDGSPDDSLEIVLNLARQDDHLTVIDLSKNFGHHKAIITGLAYSTGDIIFLIDSDLEEDPEYMLPFEAEMKKKKCDVVYGVQQIRRGYFIDRFVGSLFYKFFNLLSGLNISSSILTARLMTRRYVKALLLHKEREIFLAGLWHITGFDQQYYEVKKHSISNTTYTLRLKIALLINSITSFSNAPLIFIFYLGILIFVISAFYLTYLIIIWSFTDYSLSGWTSVIASIWLLGGLIISFIGVIGIYISKIYSEIKQRPLTIIRKIYGKKYN